MKLVKSWKLDYSTYATLLYNVCQQYCVNMSAVRSWFTNDINVCLLHNHIHNYTL